MSKLLSKADEKFASKIVERGGELLAPTSEWEVLRFKTRFGAGVVYVNSRGVRNWNGPARSARDHLSGNKPGSLAPVRVHGRRTGNGTVARILERDGSHCFFCGKEMGDDITVEHLVPVAHGGPNHISNLFLADSDCNLNAGHLSAPEKIAMREALRRAEAA